MDGVGPSRSREVWARIGTIVLVDLVLAGDNALVIAMAVRGLPGRVQVLGAVWGTIAAMALRIAFTLAAAVLLPLPGVQGVAAAVLAWIAFRFVRGPHDPGEPTRGATSLREAIWIIPLADVAMSFDNVLAVASAAAGDWRLMVSGVLLSLPLVIWGSRLLASVTP